MLVSEFEPEVKIMQFSFVRLIKIANFEMINNYSFLSTLLEG
jgi:hypothetical protein